MTGKPVNLWVQKNKFDMTKTLFVPKQLLICKSNIDDAVYLSLFVLTFHPELITAGFTSGGY